MESLYIVIGIVYKEFNVFLLDSDNETRLKTFTLTQCTRSQAGEFLSNIYTQYPNYNVDIEFIRTLTARQFQSINQLNFHLTRSYYDKRNQNQW